MSTTASSPAVPAATVLILRDTVAGLEVLMIERHADIGFAGGALVFPGGRIEAADGAESWLGRADGLDGLDALERSARVAAVREAFEETGLVLARRADGSLADASLAATLQGERAAVEADAGLFLPLMARAGLRLACDLLQRFARWIPPEGLHKRFDTWFWLAPMPPGQVALEDGGEATAALWTGPQAALDALAAGTRKIIFPTARNLELLALSGSVASACADAAARPVAIVQPRMVTREDGGWLEIPDGLGYPVTRERLDTALRG